jgi:hypothetical protein
MTNSRLVSIEQLLVKTLYMYLNIVRVRGNISLNFHLANVVLFTYARGSFMKKGSVTITLLKP